jgi:hypothetical protein
VKKKILKKFLEDTAPEGITPPLDNGERVCPDGQVLSSGKECVPGIVRAIEG